MDKELMYTIKGHMRSEQDILDDYEEGRCSRGKLLEVLATKLCKLIKDREVRARIDELQLIMWGCYDYDIPTYEERIKELQAQKKGN